MTDTTPRARAKSAASRAAILVRHRGEQDPETIEARRTHAELAIEAAIVERLAAAPPLRPEQIDRIASILRGSAR